MTNDSIAFLVDTNVLVYAYDQAEPQKQRQAIEVLITLKQARTGALSVQVLGEFFSATTRRLKPPLSVSDAAQAVSDFYHSWPVLEIYKPMVVDAVRGVIDHKLSYYDAMIWATARYHGVPFLLSEDLSSGRIVEGVRIVNPFTADFDLRILS